MKLLALDPGVRGVGVAVWVDRKLTLCAHVRTPNSTLADCAPDLAQRVEALLGKLVPIDWVAVELMQVYDAGKNRVDPNDLIACAHVGGTIAGRLRSRHLTPRPHEWRRGSLPKAVAHRRISALLSIEDSRVVNAALLATRRGWQHNVLDAVGIGLWALAIIAKSERRGYNVDGRR